MDYNKPRIAIAHGDTNGIGYETLFRVFGEQDLLSLFVPIIYGSPKVATYHRKAYELNANFTIIKTAQEAKEDRVNLLPTFEEEVKVEMGTATPESRRAALTALNRALSDQAEGLVDAIVSLPIADNTLLAPDGSPLTLSQHAELHAGAPGTSLTIHVSDNLRMAIAYEGSLSQALQQLSKESLLQKAALFHESLLRDFRLSTPRIALLRLNAQPSTEETDILKPAVDEARERHLGLFGPYSPEDFFTKALYTQFDGVLAMHHDQGMIAFNLLSQNEGVTFCAGLPNVIVSTGNGDEAAFNRREESDEQRLRNALYMAIDTLRNRITYDEPLGNPLKKLYHEKRDESEKVRFNTPKKTEPAAKQE